MRVQALLTIDINDLNYLYGFKLCIKELPVMQKHDETNRSMNLQINKFADLPSYRYAILRTCNLMDLQSYGFCNLTDLQSYGFANMEVPILLFRNLSVMQLYGFAVL